MRDIVLNGNTRVVGRVCDGSADTVGFAACPFCGRTAFDIDHEEDFDFLDEKYSKASLHMRCATCDVEMWEHTFDEHVYGKRLRLLAEKWNRRAAE